MSSDGLIVSHIKLSESAAAYTLYSYELVEHAELFSSLADDLVYSTVHASRAESGDCTRDDALGS